MLGSIAKLTSVKSKLRIKRKTKEHVNGKVVWWYVIHAQESDLNQLEAEWSTVHAQTQWRLETPAQASSCEATGSPQDGDTTHPADDTIHPTDNTSDGDFSHTGTAASIDTPGSPINDTDSFLGTSHLHKSPKP